MDKETYLRYLKALLATRIPEREAEDILRYYIEYFEEAGEGREAEVIAELGSPEELARQIMEQRAQEPQTPVIPERKKPKIWMVLLGVGALIFLARTAMPMIHRATVPHAPVPEETAILQATYVSQVYEGADMVSVEAFTRLEVDIDFGDVSVFEGENFEVHSDCSALPGYTIHCEREEDGTLKVWSEGSSKGWEIDTPSSVWVDIYLPAGCGLDDVNIHTDLGDVNWYPSGTIQQAEISTSLGDVNWLGEVRADTLDLRTDLGDVTWYAPGVACEAELETSMGNVEVAGLQAEVLEAETSMGNVILTMSSGDGFRYDLSTDMGKVSVNGSDSDKKASGTVAGGGSVVEGHSSMGNVELAY